MYSTNHRYSVRCVGLSIFLSSLQSVGTIHTLILIVLGALLLEKWEASSYMGDCRLIRIWSDVPCIDWNDILERE